MTFSYNAAEPTAKDRIRGMIGDTQEQAVPSLSLRDETIAAILAENDNELSAAIACINRLLAAAAARDVGSAGRGAGLDVTRRFERLRELRTLLRQQLAASRALPSAPYQDPTFRQARADAAAAGTELPTPFEVGFFDANL